MWFYRPQGRCLFVFDNADCLDDDEDSPSYVDLQGYLPDAPCVEILITTQTRTGTGLTRLEAIEVGHLAPTEALDVFIRCGKLRNPSLEAREEIAKIVKELDYLARAVTAAGAYFAATPHIRSNIKAYLPGYRRWRKGLLGNKARQQIHRYGESVLTTWETSYAAIERQCPVATRLLGFCTFLNSEDVFLELFRSQPRYFAKSPWEIFLSPDGPFSEAVHEALTALSRYCLLTWTEEQGSYLMHKLVHDWAFKRLTSEERKAHLSASLALLETITYDSRLDLDQRTRVVPHILASVRRLHEWRETSSSLPERCVHMVSCLATFLEDAQQCQVDAETKWFVIEEREHLMEAAQGQSLQESPGREVALSSKDKIKLHTHNERWGLSDIPGRTAQSLSTSSDGRGSDSPEVPPLVDLELDRLWPQWDTPHWLDESWKAVGFISSVGPSSVLRSHLDRFMDDEANIKLDAVELTILKRSKPFYKSTSTEIFYARTSASSNRFVSKKHNQGAMTRANLAKIIRIQTLCNAFALHFNDWIDWIWIQSPLDIAISSCLQTGRGVDQTSCEISTLEPYLEGDFVKYNNNAGWVNKEVDDNRSNQVAQAFSHFTFERSRGRYLAGRMSVV